MGFVVLPIIILLGLLGTWAAFRKSPLFSYKTAGKLVGITVVIVALVLGVAQLNLSPNALAITLVVMIPFIGIGATALIIHITDSHVAKLPPSTRLLTVHRHRVYRWIWRLLILLLLCGAATAILPDSWRWLPSGVGGFLLLGCGPMVMGFYMRARRLDFGMSQVMGAYWVHWQYSPSQWKDWAQSQLEWERAQVPPFSWKRDGLVYLKVGSTLYLIFAVCALVELSGSLGSRLMTATAFTGGMTALFAIAQLINRGNCERNYRRLVAAPSEVYFGDEGLFCNGKYSPWILSGSYLIEAKAAQDAPARLTFVFQTFGGGKSVAVEKRIPIPVGSEADVAVLQAKLRTACPKAFVSLMA